MIICDSPSLFTFSDPCVRNFWTAILPPTVIVIILLSLLPSSRLKVHLGDWAIIPSILNSFITLAEAEALDAEEFEEKDTRKDNTRIIPLWRTLVISSVALLECLSWLMFGCYTIIANDPGDIWTFLFPFGLSLSWLYISSRPILRPFSTAPFDLLISLGLKLGLGIFKLGGDFYDHVVFDAPLPSNGVMTAQILNLSAICLLLMVVMALPLALPSKFVDKEEIVRGQCFIPYFSLNSLDVNNRERRFLQKTILHFGNGSASYGSLQF